MKKNKAFTLAEVLVAILIIGTIATLTVPALFNQAKSKQAYSMLTKAQISLTNAVGAVEAEQGPIRFWTWKVEPANGREATDSHKFYAIDRLIVPKLKIAKKCGTNSSLGCFSSNYQIKTISNVLNNKFGDGSWYTFVTTDGLYWAAYQYDGIKNEGTYIKKAFAIFEVDINGPQKPNKIGYDVFGFQIRADGVYPFGGCPNGECSTSTCKSKTDAGWGCTAELLNTGKIEW